MQKYETFFGEIIDLDALSPEAKEIYAAVKKYYNENVDKPLATDPELKNIEWVGLLNTYIDKIKEVRAAKGGGRLTLEDALHKLYNDLDTRFCLKKQEQRKAQGKNN